MALADDAGSVAIAVDRQLSRYLPAAAPRPARRPEIKQGAACRSCPARAGTSRLWDASARVVTRRPRPALAIAGARAARPGFAVSWACRPAGTIPSLPGRRALDGRFAREIERTFPGAPGSGEPRRDHEARRPRAAVAQPPLNGRSAGGEDGHGRRGRRQRLITVPMPTAATIAPQSSQGRCAHGLPEHVLSQRRSRGAEPATSPIACARRRRS